MLQVSATSSVSIPPRDGELVGPSAPEGARAVLRRDAGGASASSVFARMAQHLAHLGNPTDAEALRELRQAFPGVPLSARVAALAGRNRGR
ncbi:transferase [Ancylobacter lacus]|uniref:transferase n=1 Tax=Ancylobacter lacus TaxID=2579970 RepID=UPI001BCE7396|nr:transferase [Ancylobacter lacus]MBS7541330.1 transferase [Ancylobacter lacus]